MEQLRILSWRKKMMETEKEEEYIKIANARIKCVKEDKGEKQ